MDGIREGDNDGSCEATWEGDMDGIWDGEGEGEDDGERDDGDTMGPSDGDVDGDRNEGATDGSVDGAVVGIAVGIMVGAKVSIRMHPGARARNWCSPSGRMDGLHPTKSEHCLRAPCHWKPSQLVTFIHANPQNSLILCSLGSTSMIEWMNLVTSRSDPHANRTPWYTWMIGHAYAPYKINKPTNSRCIFMYVCS